MWVAGSSLLFLTVFLRSCSAGGRRGRERHLPAWSGSTSTICDLFSAVYWELYWEYRHTIMSEMLVVVFFCFTWTCCSNITFIFTHLQHLSLYYFNFNLHHCRSLGGHTYCQYPSAWLGSGVINACVQCGDTADTASSPLECCTRMLVPWGGSIDICNVQPLDYSICTLLWGMWEKYTNHIIENISVNGYLNHTWNQSILQFTATEIPRQNPFLFVCCVGSYGCLVLWVSGQ